MKTIDRSPIGEAFYRARAEGRAALIPFLVAGDPNEQPSIDCIAAAAEYADILEIGIPYSDPLADGPTIQAAAHRARMRGATFDSALRVARAVSARTATPLIGFTYYNPVLVRGVESCAKEFVDAGLAGIIVPDLPIEEATPLLAAFRAENLSVTLLVAPTTQPVRARAIAQQCTDFVYVVSRLGVTGATGQIGESARSYVERVRGLTSKPLAIGFGVAAAADARSIAAFADGVIVGSALIDRLARAERGAEQETVRRFCRELQVACVRRPATW